MRDAPPPQSNLSRALIFGAVLAIGGIGLFLLLYFVIFSGLEDASRLLISLIVPPLVMGVVVGAYILVTGKAR